MGDVVDLKDYRNPGNGAREALIGALVMAPNPSRPSGIELLADYLLAHLWAQEFKIVPLDGAE